MKVNINGYYNSLVVFIVVVVESSVHLKKLINFIWKKFSKYLYNHWKVEVMLNEFYKYHNIQCAVDE